MEITRYYDSIWTEKLKPNKVLVLIGARRVGKTKLIENFFDKIPNSYSTAKKC